MTTQDRGRRMLSLKSSLQKQLAGIGTKNSTACPDSRRNSEGILHELFIAAEGYRFFDNRRKHALELVKQAGFCDNIPPPGEEVVLQEADYYMLTCKVSAPSVRVTTVQVHNGLVREGWSKDKINGFIKSVGQETKPATTIKSVPKL